MFGLDSRIAGLSDGTKLLVIIGVSILLGLRHATDPDHVTAVATLFGSAKERTTRAAARLGGAWGLGHATTIVLCGVPIVLFKTYLPEPVQQAAETAVGFMITALAIWLLVRWRRGLLHAHLHQHDGHAHLHVHTHASVSSHPHERPIRARTALQAYGIGVFHGIGGSAGVGLLLLASIHSHAYALVGLTLFALFTAVSMTLLSTLFGLALTTGRVGPLFGRLVPTMGIASLGFGIWYSLAALQVVA